ENLSAKPILADAVGFGANRLSDRMEQFRSAVSQSALQAAVKGESSSSTALAGTLQYLEHPSPETSELYFSAVRDDAFGGGRVRVGAPQLNLFELVMGMISRRHRRSFGVALAESQWPWALLHRDLPMLARILRTMILLSDARLSPQPTSSSTS